MPKKINAKELAGDIRNGMGNAAIMKKYELTPQAYQGFVKKLIAAGVITREEIQQRGKPNPAKKPSPQPGKPNPVKKPASRPGKPMQPAQKQAIAEPDPMINMKTCPQCGHKALPWEGGCPNCGMGENDVDHIMSYDPVSVIFRFFASALFFGFPVVAMYRYTLGIFFGMSFYLFIGIPLVWGVLGIFYYEKVTTLARDWYDKWAENWRIYAVVLSVIGMIIVMINFGASHFSLVGNHESAEASKFTPGMGAETSEDALEKYVRAILVKNDAKEAIEYLTGSYKQALCEHYRLSKDSGLLDEDPVLTPEDFDLPDEELIFRIMESRASAENPNTPEIEDETFEILKTQEFGEMIFYLFQIDDYQGNASAVKDGGKWYLSMCSV